jgi:hypothetical protein
VNTVPRLKGRSGTLVVSLKGVPVSSWSYDLASGRGGPEGTDPAARPDTRISGPGPAFIMAAAGRDHFSQLLAEGVLGVEGDRDLAEAFLGALRIV